jgi:hypothetical protein
MLSPSPQLPPLKGREVMGAQEIFKDIKDIAET